MFIDTHSEETMILGTCKCLDIEAVELKNILTEAVRKSEKNNRRDLDIFNNIINGFIYEKKSNIVLDKIQFYHLTRRLNSTSDDNSVKNLHDLLITKNKFSDFLRDHDVKIIPNQKKNKLILIYKDSEVPLKDISSNTSYLRSRLGHNKTIKDYCVNGFMFRDLICKNSYIRDLYEAPEFIDALARFLNRPDIVENYYENSKYYCFEYCLPFDDVLFDNNRNLSFEEKQKHLLNRILNRLYQYKFSNSGYMFNNDNPILSLKDYYTIDEKYFKKKEEIHIT